MSHDNQTRTPEAPKASRRAAPAAAPADPIFAAIDKHRKAATAYATSREVGEAFDKLMWAAHRALKNLLATTPTTLPGAVALLKYLGEPDIEHDPSHSLLSRVLSPGGVFDVEDAANKLPGILVDVISRNMNVAA